jgi:hypothetical protein
MPVDALDQIPPPTPFANVVVLPMHTEVFPMIAGRTGNGFTVKTEALATVPDGAVTAIVPVVAAAGKVAVICVSLFTVNDATVPLKVTDVAPVK